MNASQNTRLSTIGYTRQQNKVRYALYYQRRIGRIPANSSHPPGWGYTSNTDTYASDFDVQIIVGVLQKYVNLAAGWRPRLFVLQQGVLKYYQVYGPNRVAVVDVLDRLRSQGDVVLVGVQIGVLEKEQQRMNGHGVAGEGLKPKAEMHVQVCQVRESKADVTKFYVDSGTSVLELRGETQDDRWVWIDAIQEAKMDLEKRQMSRIDEHSTVHSKDHFKSQTEHIRQKLEELGGSQSLITYVVGLVTDMHTRYHDLADSEFSKRKTLLDIVYRLENEKRQLETNAAVEGRLMTEQARGNESPQESSYGEEDDETMDMREESARNMEPQMSSDEEFFECETFVDAHEHYHSRHTSLGDLAEFDAVCSLNEDGLERQPTSMESATKSEKWDDGGKEHGIDAAKKELPTPAWMLQEGEAPQRRTALPLPKQQERSVSLWSLIKEMVGKDLTRVCLPVYFNEPLSALEKTAEDLEYSELLDEAYMYPKGSLERIVRVAAFAISPYSSTVGRTSKPFNPLLGETYELVSVEKGFRFISEKVSHHPTIIAAYAEGRGWTYQGDAEVKSKFWGRSIELKPEGVLRLDFDDGDQYFWNKVTTSINNLILGKIYVDHGGIMKIHNTNSDMVMKIRFKETGMLFDRVPRQVEGFVESRGQKLEYPQLSGHWDSKVHVLWGPNKRQSLWKKNPPPENPTRYNLTSFAIQLNEITPGLQEKLAPTDSRLRPDQSFTERGMWEEANAEKQRLEHKQRAARKAADEGIPLKPRWFSINFEEVDFSRRSSSKRHISSRELSFEFNGEYWPEREKGSFTNCRDIFGPLVQQT